MNKLLIVFIIAFALFLPQAGAVPDENGIDYEAYKDSWDILDNNKANWNCVDIAVNFSRNNPEWGLVVLSPSKTFKVQPHMVNYKIEGNKLIIHDAGFRMTQSMEIVENKDAMIIPYSKRYPELFSPLWNSYTYYHFIEDEDSILRYSNGLKDNRKEFFDFANLTSDNVIPRPAEWDSVTCTPIDTQNNNNRFSAVKKSILAENKTSSVEADESKIEAIGFLDQATTFLEALIGSN